MLAATPPSRAPPLSDRVVAVPRARVGRGSRRSQNRRSRSRRAPTSEGPSRAEPRRAGCDHAPVRAAPATVEPLCCRRASSRGGPRGADQAAVRADPGTNGVDPAADHRQAPPPPWTRPPVRSVRAGGRRRREGLRPHLPCGRADFRRRRGVGSGAGRVAPSGVGAPPEPPREGATRACFLVTIVRSEMHPHIYLFPV